MNEFEKRARVLLAAKFDEDGHDLTAVGIRAGMYMGDDIDATIRAIEDLLIQQDRKLKALMIGIHRLKQQSLRRARTIKARNQKIRELQGAQP